MFDGRLRAVIDPPLNAMGERLARAGVTADMVTIGGWALGMAAATAIAFGAFALALALIICNRVFDGLDGAIARATSKTDRGGYLDIVLDFVFYGAVPLAFAVYAPEENALAAAALLFSFYANGASFLTFSIFAERRGLTTAAQGEKSIFYMAGLAEGAETIAVFCLFCLFPAAFPWLAYAFAAVCCLSAAARIIGVSRILSRKPTTE